MQNIHIDAVMTGYLAEDAHIDVALEIIADVRASNPDAIILIDPVDSLAATFLAHLLMGDLRRDALAKSVASIFAILSAAVSEDAGELPLIREQDALIIAKPLPIEIL